MTQKSSKIPNFDAVLYKQATIHDSKYGTTRVLFASTYTAKQMKTMYYSLNVSLYNLREVSLSLTMFKTT